MATSASSSGPPSLATIQFGEANDVLRYPDSAATSHMTPSVDILSHKLPHSGTSNVIVGNGT